LPPPTTALATATTTANATGRKWRWQRREGDGVAFIVLLAASAAVAAAAKNGGGGAGRETEWLSSAKKIGLRVHAILSKYNRVHYLTGEYLHPQDLIATMYDCIFSWKI
jgi:hypothetical protein